MAKHARTTITVPADLKARMEVVAETVNWSAIACSAFEQKLGEITKRKGAKDMKEVIDRLRASKQKHESDQYKEGHEAGREWAKNEAEAGELIRLEKLHDACSPAEWGQFFWTSDRDAYGAAELFVFKIWPDDDGDRDAARNFWDGQGHEEYPDDDFVRAFAEGALEIWGHVKGKL
jgi:hypothetical protein